VTEDGPKIGESIEAKLNSIKDYVLNIVGGAIE
jgi:hypothetical protein